MTLPDQLLTPIPGENPCGKDLRLAPIVDKIKEARREDDLLDQGVWQRERKVADHNLVIKLASDAIATQSKDLQLAAWLTESLLRRDGYGGLASGLGLCRALIDRFWDSLYPQLEDGDAEFRAASLNYIGDKFDFPLKKVALCQANYDFYQYKASRTLGYEDQAKTKEQKAEREKAIKGGTLAPEVFDKSFRDTPKAFYVQAEKSLDECIGELKALDETCNEKFGDAAPAFGRLKNGLDEVRHVVHSLLMKKRETEPDPVVEEKPPEAPAPVEKVENVATPEAATNRSPRPAASGSILAIQAPEEPADRKAAIKAIVEAAAVLRQLDSASPAPYLMLRGLRWGELRMAVAKKDYCQLDAPPTELRRAIKQMSLAGKWRDLIEAAENAMALPCTRAWMDLQRFVIEACAQLGADYQQIALAIRSELRALVRDVPEIFELSLMDDTAAANPETQAWLRQLAEEPQDATPKIQLRQPLTLDGHSSLGWQQRFVDTFALAQDAVRSGQEQQGLELLYGEVQRQRSGRLRFEKRLQFVQLCTSTGKEALAQPLLDDLLSAIDTYKLEEWEDPEMVASALLTILSASKRIQGDAKEKQKIYDRICRLSPVRALSAG